MRVINTSKELNDYFTERGIKNYFSTPYEQWQNGLAEAFVNSVTMLGEETGFFRKFTTFFRKMPKLSAKTARAFAGPAEAFIIPPRRL